MNKRFWLPFILVSGSILGAGAYALFFLGDVPTALTYGVIDPLIVAGFGLFARLHPRAGVQWYIRAMWAVLPIIALNIPGTFWLHDMPIQYDRFLHLAVAALSLNLAYIVFSPFTHAFRNAFIITFIGLFAYEGYSWSSDRLIGTAMFTDNGQSIERDVAEDITLGFVGMLIATPFLVSSRRRR